jgi:hypothetical protein
MDNISVGLDIVNVIRRLVEVHREYFQYNNLK